MLAVIENGSILSIDGEINIHGLQDLQNVSYFERWKRKRSVGERTALSDSALKVGHTACRVPLLL